MRSSLESVAAFLRTRRRKKIDDPRLVRAAVLVPFFERDGRLHLLLTRRTDTVEHHKGQISFPGGTRDTGDVSATATALREAEEEIGLPHDSVEVLGSIDDLATPTGFIITPVVGMIAHLPDLRPHPQEVSEILFVPLSVFTDAANEASFDVERDGIRRRVYRYRFEGHEIWGATAAIIREFLLELRAAGIVL